MRCIIIASKRRINFENVKRKFMKNGLTFRIQQILLISTSVLSVSLFGSQGLSDSSACEGTCGGSGGSIIKDAPLNDKQIKEVLDGSADKLKKIFTTMLSSFTIMDDKLPGFEDDPISDLKKIKSQYLTTTMVKKLSGKNKYRKTIFDILNTPPLFDFKTSCLDRNKQEQDLVAYENKNTICVNVDRIKKNTNKQDYVKKITALLGHEFSHFTEFIDDIDETKSEGLRLQNMIEAMLQGKNDNYDFAWDTYTLIKAKSVFYGSISLKINRIYHDLEENPGVSKDKNCERIRSEKNSSDKTNSLSDDIQRVPQIMLNEIKTYGYFYLDTPQEVDALQIIILKIKNVLTYCGVRDNPWDLLLFVENRENALNEILNNSNDTAKIRNIFDVSNLLPQVSINSQELWNYRSSYSDIKERRIKILLNEGYIYNLQKVPEKLFEEVKDIVELTNP